jgi:hypothetical protein
MTEPNRRAELRSIFRFLAGVAALVGTYLAGFVMLEMLATRLA